LLEAGDPTHLSHLLETHGCGTVLGFHQFPLKKATFAQFERFTTLAPENAVFADFLDI